MTDTSKYEGHTPGPWLASKELPTGWAVITGDDDWILRVDENNKGQLMSEADAQLIADAPLLLAEVKRLRKREETFDEFIDSLDVFNEHEWMLIQRIDEIHKRLHHEDLLEVIE